MKLLHIFQFWTDPKLYWAPRFWYHNEVTPKGYRLLTILGICFVFDTPEISI